MKSQLRKLRDNIASISVAVRASHEYTRSAAQAAEGRERVSSPLAGIPI